MAKTLGESMKCEETISAEARKFVYLFYTISRNYPMIIE